MRRGETLEDVLTPLVYVYLGCWLILFIFGVVFQYKTRSEEEKKNDRDENADYFLVKSPTLK